MILWLQFWTVLVSFSRGALPKLFALSCLDFVMCYTALTSKAFSLNNIHCPALIMFWNHMNYLLFVLSRHFRHHKFTFSVKETFLANRTMAIISKVIIIHFASLGFMRIITCLTRVTANIYLHGRLMVSWGTFVGSFPLRVGSKTACCPPIFVFKHTPVINGLSRVLQNYF